MDNNLIHKLMIGESPVEAPEVEEVQPVNRRARRRAEAMGRKADAMRRHHEPHPVKTNRGPRA